MGEHEHQSVLDCGWGWSMEQYNSSERNASLTIEDIFALNESMSWVLFSTDGSPDLKIASTVDAGEKWSTSSVVLSLEDELSLSGVGWLHFVDSRNGWLMLRRASSVVFSSGILLKTIDGGATWSKMREPPIAGPIRFMTQSDGWLVGGPAGDEIYVTRNGGGTWAPIRFVPPDKHQAEPATYDLPLFHSARAGSIAVTYHEPNNSTLVVFSTDDGG